MTRRDSAQSAVIRFNPNRSTLVCGPGGPRSNGAALDREPSGAHRDTQIRRSDQQKKTICARGSKILSPDGSALRLSQRLDCGKDVSSRLSLIDQLKRFPKKQARRVPPPVRLPNRCGIPLRAQCGLVRRFRRDHHRYPPLIAYDFGTVASRVALSIRRIRGIDERVELPTISG